MVACLVAGSTRSRIIDCVLSWSGTNFESWPASTAPPPLAGFSFSPITSQDADRDPAQDLARLLNATNPDLVRLPIYWELVQPTPRTLDFSSVDSLLEVVARHNATAERL